MNRLSPSWNKVPAITAVFWIMKIAATTLGETAGDMLSMTMNLGYALSSVILMGIFLVLVSSQLAARRFYPLLYWSVILATSTAGTTMSDYMDRTLGIGYMMGSAIILAILLAVLAIWKVTVGTLRVQDIRSFRVEALYWTAILFSNTLGTALGDFLTDDSGLGFAGGALLIGGLLALVLLAYFFTKISRVALFWIAFVLTRPFGATLGDVFSKTQEQGGLGFGTIGSSAVLAAILAIFVAYTMLRPAPKGDLVPEA